MFDHFRRKLSGIFSGAGQDRPQYAEYHLTLKQDAGFRPVTHVFAAQGVAVTYTLNCQASAFAVMQLEPWLRAQGYGRRQYLDVSYRPAGVKEPGRCVVLRCVEGIAQKAAEAFPGQIALVERKSEPKPAPRFFF
jgi:hypothetical protein